MRGRNWDGTPVDLQAALKPVVNAMLTRQQDLNMTGREVSLKLGCSHTWLAELIHKMENPRLGRFCRWAHAIEVQELGLFLILDGKYSEHCVYAAGQLEPWEISESGRQIPNLRPALTDFAALLREHRKQQAVTLGGFIALKNLKIANNILSNLESGDGITSPTVGRLATWAETVGAQEFGVYVIIDGAFTEAPLIGEFSE